MVSKFQMLYNQLLMLIIILDTSFVEGHDLHAPCCDGLRLRTCIYMHLYLSWYFLWFQY